MKKEISSFDDSTLTNGKMPIHIRIKALQCETMTTLFHEIMKEFNISVLRYKEKSRVLLQQQKMLTTQDNSSKVLELLDSDEESLFVDNILKDSRITRQELVELQDIRSRHNYIIELEKSIVKLNNMFIDITVLIDEQGDKLNNLEYFTGKTANTVDDGCLNLVKANKRRRRKRKIKFVIIISIIVVFFLIVILFL